MSIYYYNVYNTIIESEVKILNIPVLPDTGNYEISARIQLTDQPCIKIPVGVYGTYFSPEICALGSMWGTMAVSGGNLIELYIKEGFTPDDASPFIIGWGFAFLFFQQGYTIFHCSALNINGKGVILSGVSGAGKSSTALSLIKSGAKYLADDMAIVSPETNFELIPAYPIQKVCRDVSVELNAEELLHINEGRDKFAYHNEAEFYNHRLKTTHIVMLMINDGEELIVREHTGVQKWMRVLECMYLNELFATFGVPEKEKYNCLKLAQDVRVLEISRPRGVDTLSKITETIEEFVNS